MNFCSAVSGRIVTICLDDNFFELSSSEFSGECNRNFICFSGPEEGNVGQIFEEVEAEERFDIDNCVGFALPNLIKEESSSVCFTKPGEVSMKMPLGFSRDVLGLKRVCHSQGSYDKSH